jgi:hypothetical protein
MVSMVSYEVPTPLQNKQRFKLLFDRDSSVRRILTFQCVQEVDMRYQNIYTLVEYDRIKRITVEEYVWNFHVLKTRVEPGEETLHMRLERAKHNYFLLLTNKSTKKVRETYFFKADKIC